MKQSDLVFAGEWPSNDTMFSVGNLRDSLFNTVAAVVQPNFNASTPKRFFGYGETRTITASNGASVSTSKKKFGASSLWLIKDLKQSVRISPGTDFSFKNSSFNLEAQVFPTTLGTTKRTIYASGRNSVNNTYALYINEDGYPCFSVAGPSGFTITGDTKVDTTDFGFLSIARNINTFVLMWKGKVIGQYQATSTLELICPAAFYIGCGYFPSGVADEFADYYDGHIDAARVVNGNAIYYQEVTTSILTATVTDKIGFTVSGTQILDAAGKAIRLTGINYGGAEHGECIPGGLWARNWKEMISQMKSLGFNVIRFPFCDDTVTQKHTTYSTINSTFNPDINGKTPLQVMKMVMDYCKSIGMFVILDHHRTWAGIAGEDGSMDHGYWYDPSLDSRSKYGTFYSENDVIANWKLLATMFADNEFIIGADLHNEPHGDVRWGTVTDPSRDWRAGAIRIANAIHSVNPNWLVFAEGTEWSNITVSGDKTNYDWWGGNFRDARDVSRRFTINKQDKAVYSVHSYGTSVGSPGWFNDETYPRILGYHYDESWGWLYRQRVAPVFIGEYGGQFTQQKDTQFIQTLVKYMNGDFDLNGGTYLQPGEQGIHSTMWCWNPTSTDTGGIVDLATWNVVDENKMQYYRPLMFRDSITPKYSSNVGSGSLPISNPTSPPGSVPGTVLLMNFDDGLAASQTSVVKSSGLVMRGNPSVVISEHRIGGGALRITPNNYYDIPYSAVFDLTDKNFVIDSIAVFDFGATGIDVIASHESSAATHDSSQWCLYRNEAGYLTFGYKPSTGTGNWTTVSGTTLMAKGVPYRVKAVRSGTSLYLFVNEKRDFAGTISGSLKVCTGDISLGHSAAMDQNADLAGLILAFRLSVNTDRGNTLSTLAKAEMVFAMAG